MLIVMFLGDLAASLTGGAAIGYILTKKDRNGLCIAFPTQSRLRLDA